MYHVNLPFEKSLADDRTIAWEHSAAAIICWSATTGRTRQWREAADDPNQRHSARIIVKRRVVFVVIRIEKAVIATSIAMNVELCKHQSAIVFFLLATAMLAFALTLKITGPELSWDGQDYAQLARQVARGEGHTTKVIIASLRLDVRADEPWPSTFRPPFPVVLTSAFFRLFGVNDTAAVLSSGLFYAGTVVLIFLSFQPIHGTEVAFLSAIIFALSGCGLTYARSGLTEPSAMFFLLCGFSLAVNKHSALSTLGAGASLSFCALNRPVACLWVVVIFGYLLVCQDCRRQSQLVRLSLGSIGFLAPLIFVKVVLHWKGGGNDLFAVNLASRIGDQALATSSPVSFLLHHPLGMLAKVLHEILRVCMYLFQFGNITLFSALSIFGLVRSTQPGKRDTRNITITLVVLTAIALAFLTEGDAFVGPLRYFDVFTPLLLPWGVSLFFELFNRVSDLPGTNFQRYAFAGLLGFYLLGAGAQAIRDPFARMHSSDHPIYKELREIVPEKQVIAAPGSVNVPSVAWYGDRRVVFIESDLEKSLALMRDKEIPVKWYFGKDSDQIPKGFFKLKQWPGGFVLFRQSD